jgi:hypothetical protein
MTWYDSLQNATGQTSPVSRQARSFPKLMGIDLFAARFAKSYPQKEPAIYPVAYLLYLFHECLYRLITSARTTHLLNAFINSTVDYEQLWLQYSRSH